MPIFALFEDLPVAGWDADSSLIIHGVEVATGKHGLPSPSIPTVFHFSPHGDKICPFLGKCQEKRQAKKKNIPPKDLSEVTQLREKGRNRIVDPCFGGRKLGLTAPGFRWRLANYNDNNILRLPIGEKTGEWG
jgi:hypothetical protein